EGVRRSGSVLLRAGATELRRRRIVRWSDRRRWSAGRRVGRRPAGRQQHRRKAGRRGRSGLRDRRRQEVAGGNQRRPESVQLAVRVAFPAFATSWRWSEYLRVGTSWSEQVDEEACS